MKLLELEINNIRGIRHTLLKPDGNNMVIWGPNGSGKSAVVDAIDFLLTGRISRLTGKGTGGITLNKYGPHIDCKPGDSTVRAIIQIPGKKGSIEIKRCMATPGTLICEENILSELEPVMSLAGRGQHVLTRREILKYITAEGGTRAQEIQELLNLTEIEDARKYFVKLQNEYKSDFVATRRNLDSAKNTLNAAVGAASFDQGTILNVINQNRAVFGAPPLSILQSKELKNGVKLPTATSSEQSLNVTLLKNEVEYLIEVSSPQNMAIVTSIDENLRLLINDIRSTPNLLENLSRRQLIVLGLELLDETGGCPLCDTSWPQGQLRNYLENKSAKAQLAAEYEQQATQLTSQLINRCESIIINIQKVVAAAQLADINEEIAVLCKWQTDLTSLSQVLTKEYLNYSSIFPDANLIKRFLAPEELSEILNSFWNNVKVKFPESTPEQTAWTTLTRLEENIKVLETAWINNEVASLAYNRSTKLINEFLKSRDTVLKKLYDSIRDRFVSLYKQLHHLDEGDFNAKLEPLGAGLNLEVDFYGRGTYPPQALHSEGHQDSMGLCLYLALAEKLTGDLINLTILDDVVMSVDVDHRRELCHLLMTAFPHRQFLITTHDKTWAHQLRSDKVVRSKGSVEFYNWNVSTGPKVNYETDIWNKIEADLEKGDVSSAASSLRRASEEYFGIVCDSLQAPVKFKLNGNWDLGDLLPSAENRYKNLLKKAKSAAHSWGNDELYAFLNEVDEDVVQIYTRKSAEEWAVNPSVHFNNWANFTKNDFIPVVEAFQDLFAVFTCTKCGGILYIALAGGSPATLRCNCNEVNWNLLPKEKSQE